MKRSISWKLQFTNSEPVKKILGYSSRFSKNLPNWEDIYFLLALRSIQEIQLSSKVLRTRSPCTKLKKSKLKGRSKSLKIPLLTRESCSTDSMIFVKSELIFIAINPQVKRRTPAMKKMKLKAKTEYFRHFAKSCVLKSDCIFCKNDSVRKRGPEDCCILFWPESSS